MTPNHKSTEMKWWEAQVSLYNTHSDNVGRLATIREVLFCDFHRDMNTIQSLRCLDRTAADYRKLKIELKSTLQCFTPAAFLKTKGAGNMTEISRTGLLQLDFDHKDICEYNIEELKRAVFNLPFIAFCGLSCSGDGFYALALIAEPYRLAEYAEHIFQVLIQYGIRADRSKGKKVENLRYVSYDENMLIRPSLRFPTEPVQLRINHFKRKSLPKRVIMNANLSNSDSKITFVNNQLRKIAEVKIGSRWETVQKVAYTLGGISDSRLLHLLKSTIGANSEFDGEEDKYCKCATECFRAGLLKPLN